MTYTLNAGVMLLASDPLGMTILTKKIELPFLPTEGLYVRVYRPGGVDSVSYWIGVLQWDCHLEAFFSMLKVEPIGTYDDEDEEEVAMCDAEFWKSYGWVDDDQLNGPLREFYNYHHNGPQLVK